MLAGKLMLKMAKKGERPRPGKLPKKCKNDKDDDTSDYSQDNNTNNSRASSKNNKKSPPEVQNHSSSSESDSFGKEDGDSDDEPELLKSCNKKTLEGTSVSPKPHGKKKTNNAIIKRTDNDNMDNYGMFIDDAPIDNLLGNLKPFIKNAIDTKLFSMVKFISHPADAKNLMDLSFSKYSGMETPLLANRKGYCIEQLGVNLSHHAFAILDSMPMTGGIISIHVSTTQIWSHLLQNNYLENIQTFILLSQNIQVRLREKKSIPDPKQVMHNFFQAYKHG